MATPRREEKKSRERQARAARLAAQRRQRTVKMMAVIGVIALLASVFVGFGMSLSSSESDDTTTTTSTTSAAEAPSTTVEPGAVITGDTPCPALDGSSPRTTKFAKSPPMCINPSHKYTATFDTTEGKIVVALDTTKTPKTANNFVVLSRYHYYDNTKIFRTDTSIDIIQSGSPHSESASDKGPGYNIEDEGSGYTYTEGDLVMARSQGPNSASAQYFFGTGPNVAQLNSQGTYVTFGKTTEGLDVLKKIIGLHVEGGSLGGAPSRPVTVNSITITES